MSRSPTRVVVLRALLYIIALLLTLGASIAIARRLTASEYAAYQFATKRIIQYSTIPLSIFGLWIYRYLSVRARGALGATYIIAAATAVLGAVLGLLLELTEAKIGLAAATAAALLLALQSTLSTISTALDALRPLRNALSAMIYRLLYFLFVVIALYLLRPDLTDLFLFTSAAMAIILVMDVRWASEVTSREDLSNYRNIIIEWALTSSPLVIGYLLGFLSSLDVIIGYGLAGAQVVAAFFIAASIATSVRESANTGLRYLHKYGLTGGEPGQAARTTMLVLEAVAPLLIYAAVYSRYVIYVYNPMYAWASLATSVFMVIAIVEVLNGGLINLAMGLIPVGREHVSQMRSFMVWTSMSSVVYVVLLASLIAVMRGLGPQALIMAWAAAYGARFIASVSITYAKFLDRGTRAVLKGEGYRALAYVALAAALAEVIRPWKPPIRGLVGSIEVILPPLVIYTTTYFLIMALVDRRFRRLVASVLRSPALALGLET